ncbi:MAG: FAD/NAD(P)-binding protein [Dehalococcoidia bacterium]|nr:FAD/NAD(P)-binding protein [Dehalococcoidia bacterium]
MISQAVPQASIYLPHLAELIRVEPIAEREKLFEFKLSHGKELGHKPGQFVEISLFGIGEMPISISSSPTKKRSFELAVRAVGNVTNALHRLSKGATVGIRGPFGNGFPLESLKHKDILIVAGGIGLFPLRSLINYILDKRSEFGRLIILSGSRTPKERMFVNELEKWHRREDIELWETVDEGDEEWTGHVGVVTTLSSEVHIDPEKIFAVVVGPPVMYKFVVAECHKKGIPDERIIMSLERRMKCGIGKCGHCQINGVYVCQEGPVFTYAEVKKLREAI